VRAGLSFVVCNANGGPKAAPKIWDWEDQMSESVYRVIEVIGTSPDSWERAAKVAVERAAGTLRDLRVAEVVEQDVQIENGKIELYRVKLNLSFKYEGGKE
jgi:dodecin